MITPRIQDMCQAYTEELEQARTNLSSSELHQYPLYSADYWSISGCCFTGTIKEHIESMIWTDSHDELKTFVDMTISRGITMFPFVFHGHIGEHPRADYVDLHPIFDGLFQTDTDRRVFQGVCYILEKTDYHLFPQPEELFKYLCHNDYLEVIAGHPMYDELVCKLLLSALHPTIQPVIEFFIVHYVFPAIREMTSRVKNVFDGLCFLLEQANKPFMSEACIVYLVDHGYLQVVRTRPELLHTFIREISNVKWMFYDKSYVEKKVNQAVKEFHYTFVHMETMAHKCLADDLLRLIGMYVVNKV